MRTAALTLICASLLLSPGCGGRSASENTLAQTSAEMAKAGDQLARDLAEGKMPSGPVVPAEELAALLPDLPGWQMGEPKTQAASMGINVTVASAEYAKDDSSITLEISDSSASQLLLAPYIAMTKSAISEKTENGYRKTLSVGGSPAVEEWDGPGNTAHVTAIVAGRFVVKATAYGVADAAPARGAIEAVNLRKLEALK